MTRQIERGTLAIIGALLVVIMVLYDERAGSIFGILMAIGAVLLLADPRISTVLERQYRPFQHILWALGGGIAVWGLSAIIVPLLTEVKQAISLNSILQLYAGAQPFFAESVIFTVIAYGICFAITETWIIWGPFGETFMEKLGVKNVPLLPFWRNKNVWGILGLISIGFAFLHFTAKQGPALFENIIIVLIMGMVTGILVVLNNYELKPAILMHIFLNVTAVLVQKAVYDPFTSIFVSIGIISAISISTKYLANLPSTLKYATRKVI